MCGFCVNIIEFLYIVYRLCVFNEIRLFLGWLGVFRMKFIIVVIFWSNFRVLVNVGGE